MDTVYKTFRAEVKGVNIETGEVDMFIPVSSMSVDRDGEIVEPSAFKKTLPKFMKRPVLVASHDYKDLTNQIGEWSRLKIGDTGMDGKPKYYIGLGNAQADWGFELAKKGMAAFSIGFIPTKWEDGDGVKSPKRTYQEVELLEISQVIVPSNRDAQQSVRSKSVDPVVKTLIDDIVNAEIVDLTAEPVKPEEHIIAKTSQEQIIDEIDYLITMIDKEGLGDKSAASLKELTKRLPGADIPVKIETPVPPIEVKETLTNLDILESIKRINGGK
jgi:HK97 family phage prohead protease